MDTGSVSFLHISRGGLVSMAVSGRKLDREATVGELAEQEPKMMLRLSQIEPEEGRFCGFEKTDTLAEVARRKGITLRTLRAALKSLG